MHWILVAKNDLRNVGIGDNKIFSEDDRPTELLPAGWNDNRTSYILRYTINKQIFILFAIVTDDSLLINLLDGKTLNTASLVLDVQQIVKSTTGATFDDFVNDSEVLIKRINDEVIQPILKKPEEKKSGESSSPLLVQQPHRPVIPHYYEENRDPFFVRDPLRDIGRGDLDPWGRGGGMIFRPDMPLRPGGIGPLRPPGVPPGARFDPPNPHGRFNPDPDHFQPPGNLPPGYDDMFM